jgi:hypothetical protein
MSSIARKPSSSRHLKRERRCPIEYTQQKKRDRAARYEASPYTEELCQHSDQQRPDHVAELLERLRRADAGAQL